MNAESRLASCFFALADALTSRGTAMAGERAACEKEADRLESFDADNISSILRLAIGVGILV